MATSDRLIEVFHEAQALSTSAERERFVAEACGDDAELKEQVSSLLRVNERAGDFLQPAGTLQTIRLEGYELLEELARGGMGVVYKARQLSLNRIVAVKMILSGRFAGKDERLRFHAEAEAAARLRHPNIVCIHETGEAEGRPYFSMDYVDGGSLADVVRSGPLGPTRAAAYVRTIAEAIHYAHEQGIWHRDLKPSNVLIDSHDELRIADFGVAKHAQTESSLTLTGQGLGSPSFMPPEQLAAKGKTGRYSDVYGIGAILYFLLTARPPFQGKTVDETLQQVVHGEPRAPRFLNPLVPLDLETICLKCIEKEPARRYQTAREVAEELKRYLHGEPILTACASWTNFRQTLWANSEYNHGFAEQADRIIPERRYLFHVVKSFLRHFAPAGTVRICDLGCGDGALAEELLGSQREIQMTLVDGHEGILGSAERRLKGHAGTRFIEATFDDIIRGALQLGPFDFVVSSFAIHHLAPFERAALFQWVNARLADGGWFINVDVALPDESPLTDWQFDLWREWIAETEKHRAGGTSLLSTPDHARNNPDNKYGKLGPQLNALRSAGFEDVDCVYRNGIFAICCGRKSGQQFGSSAQSSQAVLVCPPSSEDSEVRIGLIGDFHPEITAHGAIARSLELAESELSGRRLTVTWLGTDALEQMEEGALKEFRGFWCVPGSPYASMAGALRCIQFARENGVPFLGTCAGFQHALIEYARNVRHIAGADHAETNAEAACVVIAKLACPLVEKDAEARLRGGSRLRTICGQPTITESYHCNYGLAVGTESLLADRALSFSARGPDGTVHALEVTGHPFYVATLFQPERAALRGAVHPVIRAFVQAAALAAVGNGKPADGARRPASLTNPEPERSTKTL